MWGTLLQLGAQTIEIANALKGFVAKHFGCDLIVHTDLNNLDHLLKERDDLLVPILSRIGPHAYVQVKQARGLRLELQNKFRAVVEMVFSEIFDLQQNIDSL